MSNLRPSLIIQPSIATLRSSATVPVPPALQSAEFAPFITQRVPR